MRDGRPCVVKMTMKDKVKDILFTPISKTLPKLDVLKQLSSNFTEMSSGRCVSRKGFRDVFSIANSAGKVDRNCELQGFLIIFGLRQLRQPALLRLPIFWFLRKIFYF